NYESSTAWEVRTGHLSIEAAREELRKIKNPEGVRKILNVIGYPAGRQKSDLQQPVVYCVLNPGVTRADLLNHLTRALPQTVRLPQLIAVAAIQRDAGGAINAQALRAGRPLESGGGSTGDGQESKSQAIPLLVGQRQLLQVARGTIDRWCQMMTLEFSEPIMADLLKRAILQVMLHHDGLRLRFARAGTMWTQSAPVALDGVPFSILDLAGCSSSKAAAVMRTAKARIRDRLNLVNGAAVRFTYFSRGVDQPGT